MGRKMKVIASNKKHLTKEEIETRKTAEERASDGFSLMQKTAPKHFSAVARAEYKRIIDDVRKLPLRNIDRAMLEMYCTWYAIYKSISVTLDKQGLLIEVPEKGMVANPLILELDRASKNIKSAASSLGLTVDSRMKMYMPTEEKTESIFDKFGS